MCLLKSALTKEGACLAILHSPGMIYDAVKLENMSLIAILPTWFQGPTACVITDINDLGSRKTMAALGTRLLSYLLGNHSF